MKKTIKRSIMTLLMTILTVFLPMGVLASPEWSVNPSDYRYDMSLYFDMSFTSTGNRIDCSRYEIASFVGEECRGIAETLSGVEGCMYMRIRSNIESGEDVTFRLKKKDTGEISDVEGVSVPFESGKVLGLPSEPLKLQVTYYYYVEITATDGGSVEFENGRYAEGTELHVKAVPDDGYGFAGWSDGISESERVIVVKEDLSLEASFTANSYMLTYLVDGEEYCSREVVYGSAITPETAPEKEGHTFVCWTDLPETMPSHDVTVTAEYSVNSYMLTYLVDGEEYRSREVAYGSAITPETAPEKEGHTFVCWTGLPETMPSHDVTVTAEYSVNSYKLTYLVDGEEYRSREVAYGSAITPETAPEKEGHTFVCWTGLPETMPSHDVTVTAEYSVNSYKLTYLVDGEEYRSREVVYGSAITPESAPEKEGYTFVCWTGLPETMPSHDVTVTAEYAVNVYKLTVYIDDTVFYEAELEMGAPVVIPEPEIPEDREFKGWQEDVPETMPAHDVEIHGTTMIISGVSGIYDDGYETLTVYSLNGVLLYKNVTEDVVREKLPHGFYIVNGKKKLM